MTSPFILLDTIAEQPAETEVLKRTSRLTKKGYYLRISRLINSGIVVRKRGKYHLTSFGKIVYEVQKLVGRAIEIRWKLAAIDSLSSNHKLAAKERNKIIDALMEGNDDMKKIFSYKKKEITDRTKKVPAQISG